MSDLTLTEQQIVDITGYKQPSRQLKIFEALGVPAHRRVDGSVSVCRQHYLELRRAQQEDRPTPKLRPIRRQHEPTT